MRIIDFHDAQLHLSRLIDQAGNGESFVIAKAGKPLVKVVPLHAPMVVQTRRTGFLAGHVGIPDDFDRMGLAKIESLFEGGE